MLSNHSFDQAAADAAIAEARAAFDRDPASLDAVARSTFELWARPDQLARASGQPAAPAPMRRSKPPTVFSSFGASPPKAPAMSEADARKLLLAQIADRRGGAAAHRCRHMTVDQLAAALGSPKATCLRQAEISKSWDSTFAKRGVEVKNEAGASTSTRREQIAASWDRALKRMGAQID